jgi:pyruvate/2-oxoglutarate dehydrogenase complex dihydrolipoamide acyltransferase (E2) component
MSLPLSTHHHGIDGEAAARRMTHLVEVMENPELMLK